MFYRVINLIFKLFVYSGYRKKYKLPKSFRFNGYFIRINGDGEFKCGIDSYISFFSYINIQKGSSIEIGNNVSIGHNVKIYTSTLETGKYILQQEKVTFLSDVKIGNNVLIGANVFICPGVCIGDNVIIGSNSVVTQNIPRNSSAAGCPAKRIKSYK